MIIEISLSKSCNALLSSLLRFEYHKLVSRFRISSSKQLKYISIAVSVPFVLNVDLQRKGLIGIVLSEFLKCHFKRSFRPKTSSSALSNCSINISKCRNELKISGEWREFYSINSLRYSETTWTLSSNAT